MYRIDFNRPSMNLIGRGGEGKVYSEKSGRFALKEVGSFIRTAPTNSRHTAQCRYANAFHNIRPFGNSLKVTYICTWLLIEKVARDPCDVSDCNSWVQYCPLIFLV